MINNIFRYIYSTDIYCYINKTKYKYINIYTYTYRYE